MTGTKAIEKKGLPTWAKVAIGIVVVVAISLSIFIGGMVWFIGNMGQKARDPVYISQVAKSIAVIDEPLPKGFVYQAAVDILGAKMIMIANDQSGLGVILGLLPSGSNPNKQPTELTKELASKGIPNISSSFKITGEGTEMVAGNPMSYVVGTSEMGDKGTIQGMIGCLVTKDKSKTIVFYGFSPGKEYDMLSTKAFLSSIKSL
jgi:hypothetical protein